MKVAPKLVLAAWLAFLPVLGIHAWISIRRQQVLFRSDMERGLSLLGEHLRRMIVTEWDLNGEPESEALLHAAARADRNVTIRWVPGASPGTERGLFPAPPDRMTWVEPISIRSQPVGRIEISESLVPLHRLVRLMVLQILVVSGVLGLASVVLARALGERLIGRRLRALVEFARRTGAGQLGHRIDLGGRDEISSLAVSLSEMSAQLAEALTQARVANAERLVMLQELRHADRLTSIGRLASGVAHELGTPLNVAMGHAQRLEKGSLSPEEARTSAQVIRRQMDRMAATIQNVLGFVRSSTPPAERVDLVSVVEDVRALFSPFLEERQVSLIAGPHPDHAPVKGSQIQLEQAVSNLVANAADVTPAGGRVEIAIESTKQSPGPGNALRPVFAVQVRDEGPGVPKESASRLFEPFFTSKPKGSGTGLGLWITQGIAHDHGGWIEFVNLPAGGACFTLLIPDGRA